MEKAFRSNEQKLITQVKTLCINYIDFFWFLRIEIVTLT